MSDLRNVYLFQVNFAFGESNFLPYSVGTLRSYCEADPLLREHYRFMRLGHRREAIDKVVAVLAEPRVLGLSCYVWNWQWNMRLAAAVRRQHPECLIVLGGPQVPDRSETFFQIHPYIDILAHGAGEVTFSDILHELLNDQPQFCAVAGLSLPGRGLGTERTQPRARLESLDRLPSPYVSGAFADILGEQAQWSASQETNRGCPYSCTFCDWGSATLTRVRHFPGHRVRAEIEWFGTHEVDTIYNCDANYGMFPQDLDWATELARQRTSTGFPRQFRTSYAKKSDRKVFDIAKVLFDAGLQRGVGISLQSLDESTLLAIRRRNLRPQKFSALVDRYRLARIPTYTELIVGLPGETTDTFKEGVDTVLDGGQHESLLIYPCQVLPNAELADRDYRKTHGVSTRTTPLRLGYSSPSSGDVEECIEIVVGTATMTTHEWREAYLFGFVVQAFHCLNLTQVIAVALRHGFGLTYREFYEHLVRFGAEGGRPLLGLLTAEGREAADTICAGGAPARCLDWTGALVWNPEEVAFLSAVRRKIELAEDLVAFGQQLQPVVGAGLTDQLLEDLVRLQLAALVGPGEATSATVALNHDLMTTVEEGYLGRSTPIRAMAPAVVTLSCDVPPMADIQEYALEMLRYGRKDNHLRRRPAPVATP